MKVSELIAALQEYFEPDEEVFFTYDSHDYWGSVLASSVEIVEHGHIQWSDYHQTYQALDENHPNYDEEKKGHREVVIIR